LRDPNVEIAPMRTTRLPRRKTSFALITVLIFQTPLRVFRLSEGREVFVFTKRLELDVGILVAVDRFSTGATAHNLRGLANAYVLACESGQPIRAEEYRTRLVGELVRRAGMREQRIAD